MTRVRLTAILMTLAGLAALYVWQNARERRIAECTASGGDWHGASSTCKTGRTPIIGHDNLRRT
jgi:hypothetical protein